jgi:hypothetical protein
MGQLGRVHVPTRIFWADLKPNTLLAAASRPRAHSRRRQRGPDGGRRHVGAGRAANDREGLLVRSGAPQAGGTRGVLTPLAASPDPFMESMYNIQ